MRRRDKRRDEAEAWALLRRAPAVRLASTTADGAPVLRTVHGVVHRGAVLLHSAVKGEKIGCLGRQAVVAADELLGEVRSSWLDPERACPATTLYRSAMAHGRLVERTEGKAEAMQALMERFQPQGGYRPFGDGFYEKALRGIRIIALEVERIEAKSALGHGKPEAWRRAVAEGLWESGQLRGLRAMIDDGCWRFDGPAGVELMPVMGPSELAEAVTLLAPMYWNETTDEDRIARAHLASPAWVGARHDGRLVATARAISDGAKLAYVMDLAVAEPWRGKGVGKAVMELLLRHPAVRACRRVELHTKTAGSFYATMDFEEAVDPAWRQTLRRSQ